MSTAQPDVGGSAPQLGIHHIGFKRVRAIAMARKKKGAIPTIGFGSMALQEMALEESPIHMLECAGQERYQAAPTVAKDRLSRCDSPPSLEIDVTKVRVIHYIKLINN